MWNDYYLNVLSCTDKRSIMEVWEGGHNILELLDYPMRGLVFEGGSTLEDLSDVIGSSCICIQHNNIPYNVLIANWCKTKKRALVEVDQEILDTQVNPSMWKNMIAFKNLNGKLIAKRQYPYIQGFGNSPGNV